MIDSYFFVPADKQKFLNKIGKINADYIVIDLEDSVANSNKKTALKNIAQLNIDNNTFVRIPFQDEIYSEEQIEWLINKFNGNIVYPKVNSISDIDYIISINKINIELNLIVLIESPICYVNILEILEKYSKVIHGIGFGSHDFCAIMGMKHEFKHLEHYKKHLILLSKAFGINYIDGVDVNIRDLSNFVEECIYAFDAGADGKFIIHPDQLSKLKDIDFLTKEELQEMEEVFNKLATINKKNIDILEVNGKIYEKPHLLRIEKIYHKLEKRKN